MPRHLFPPGSSANVAVLRKPLREEERPDPQCRLGSSRYFPYLSELYGWQRLSRKSVVLRRVIRVPQDNDSPLQPSRLLLQGVLGPAEMTSLLLRAHALFGLFDHGAG